MCDIFLQPLASHRPVAFLLIGITPETLPRRDLLLKLAPTSEVPVYCSLTPFLRSRQGQYTVAHTPKPCPLHWSGRRDSNPRPRPWQGRALPTELLPRGGIFGLAHYCAEENTSNPFRGHHTGATLWNVHYEYPLNNHVR